MTVKIDNHEEQALARLVEQFKHKESIRKFFAPFVTQTQALEDASFQLFTLRNIDSSEGVNLDIIGKIVGERRQGVSDPIYRLRIRARIRANLSSGTVENIYSVFRALFGPSPPVGLQYLWQDTFPAGFIITLANIVIDPTELPVFVQFLKDSRGGGIEAHLVTQPTPDDDAFTLAICTMLTVDVLAGVTSLPVIDTEEFTDTGMLLLDQTLADEELVPYTGRTVNSFTGLITTKPHLENSSVALVPSPGKGFGDDTNPVTGGALVSVSVA